MALSMTNATYARSSSGTNKLINQCLNDVQKMQRAIKNYNALINAIDQNWIGPDATAFKNAIIRRANRVDVALGKIRDLVFTAMRNQQYEFNSLQNSNASIFSNIR